MGRHFKIDGERVEYEEDATVSDLKRDAGFPDEDIVVYLDEENSNPVPVSDRDPITVIPEGAPVASQPSKGRLFG